MTWQTSLPIITSSLLTIVGVSSFVMNAKSIHDTSKTNSLIRQRSSIRKYAVDVLNVMQNYTNLEIAYLRERLKIDQDLANNKSISNDRSIYVYQLKHDLKQAEVALQSKIWNSHIEISRLEFRDLQSAIFKSFRRIKILTKNINIEHSSFETDLEINVLNGELNNEIQALLKQFATAQNKLTKDIQNISLFDSLKQKFHKK